jgi:hypothetical protein
VPLDNGADPSRVRLDDDLHPHRLMQRHHTLRRQPGLDVPRPLHDADETHHVVEGLRPRAEDS